MSSLFFIYTSNSSDITGLKVDISSVKGIVIILVGKSRAKHIPDIVSGTWIIVKFMYIKSNNSGITIYRRR